MKKLLALTMLACLLSLFLTSCYTESTPYYQQVNHEIIYQGCEYVYFGAGTGTWGSHKGNCKNHPTPQEEMRELDRMYDKINSFK